jgi:cysteinyl-tRNA synthetase
MKFIKIGYEQLFPTGVYANQRYYAEMSVDDSENITEAYRIAKQKVEETFAALNPQIKWEELQSEVPQEVQVERKISNTEDALIADINTCKDLKVLESYRLLANKNERVKAAYDEKAKQFI